MAYMWFRSLLLILTALAVSGAAQESLAHKERMEKVAERVKQELQLSDEQSAQVKKINEDAAKQIQQLRVENFNRRDRIEKTRKVQEARDEQLKNLLKPEQWEKYQKLRGELRELGHGAAREKTAEPKP